MATLTKNFNFNASGTGGLGTAHPGYTSEGGSWIGVDGTFSAGSGQTDGPTADPSGATGIARQQATSGKNKSQAVYLEWSGTWEDLGVPAGSTVTNVQVSPYWRCATYTTGAASTVGPIVFDDSADALQGTFAAGLGYSATSVWALRTGATLAVPAGLQASSSTVRFRLNATVATGASNTALNALRWDFVSVVVTYTAPVTPTQTSVARLSLASASTPATQTAHSIHVRAKRNTATAATIRAALYEGATNRSGDLESAALTASIAEYTLAIPDANAANITSYADLEIRLWAYDASGGTGTVDVADVWLDIPAAPSGPTLMTLDATAGSAMLIVKQANVIRPAATASAATILAVKAKLATLAVASATVAVLVKRPARLFAASSATSTTLVRIIARSLSATSTPTAVIATLKARLVTFAVSAVLATSLVRQPRIVRAASSVSATTLARTVGAIRAASSACSAQIVKAAAITRSCATATAAVIVAVKAKLLSLSAASVAAASVIRQVRVVRAVTTAGSAVLAIAVSLHRQLLAATTSAAAIVRRTAVVRAAAVGSTATLVAARVRLFALSVASTTVATTRRAVSSTRTATSSTVTVALKLCARTITVTQSAAASVARARAITLTAIAGTIATFAAAVAARILGLIDSVGRADPMDSAGAAHDADNAGGASNLLG